MQRLARWVVGATLGVVVFSGGGVAHAAALTPGQIQAMLDVLSSFGADQATINNVSAALGGNTTSVTPLPDDASIDQVCVAITRTLSLGSTDAGTHNQVSLLQESLGINPTGYFGPLTKQAVIAWQRAHGINPIGVVGPATRAAMMCTTQPVATEQPAMPDSIPANHPPLGPDVTDTPPTAETPTEPAVSVPLAQTPATFVPPTYVPPPQTEPAVLQVSPTAGSAPLPVQLLYAASFVNGATFYVDFGDGVSGSMAYGYTCSTPNSCVRSWNVSHTYVSPGTFTIKLVTPTDPSANTCTSAQSPGCTLLRQATVTIY